MDFLKKVHHALVIPGNEELGYSTTRWINYDTAPLPPGRRTWNTINYLAFWGVAQYDHLPSLSHRSSDGRG